MATLVCQASKYIFALWCTGLKHFNVLPTFSIVHKGLPCLVYKDGSIHDKFLFSLLQSWPCFENNIHRTREKPTGIKAKRSFPSAGRFSTIFKKTVKTTIKFLEQVCWKRSNKRRQKGRERKRRQQRRGRNRSESNNIFCSPGVITFYSLLHRSEYFSFTPVHLIENRGTSKSAACSAVV